MTWLGAPTAQWGLITGNLRRDTGSIAFTLMFDDFRTLNYRMD